MSPNCERLLDSLRDMGEFATRIGAGKEGAAFESLRRRLESDKRPSKSLEEEIFKQSRLAAFWIPARISSQSGDAAGKEELKAEFSRLKQAIDDAMRPMESPLFSESVISGLGPSGESTTVYGDPRDAKNIADRAIESVLQFSTAVFSDDLDGAYALCASELRRRISKGRLAAELARSERHFGGKAIGCKIERIPHLFADDISRRSSRKDQGDWPRDTPRAAKRATVGAFWFTNLEENRGRWAFFWVTEEAGAIESLDTSSIYSDANRAEVPVPSAAIA